MASKRKSVTLRDVDVIALDDEERIDETLALIVDDVDDLAHAVGTFEERQGAARRVAEYAAALADYYGREHQRLLRG